MGWLGAADLDRLQRAPLELAHLVGGSSARRVSEAAARSLRHNGAVPAVLFLCVHNAGRSQMAAGWMRRLAADRIDVYAAGSEPADRLNPAAVAAMREVGIDITAATPTRWDEAMLDAADVVVTMGCGDACPFVPGTRYVDWPLDDPAGRGVAEVRPIRDEIERRVRALMAEMAVDPA